MFFLQVWSRCGGNRGPPGRAGREALGRAVIAALIIKLRKRPTIWPYPPVLKWTSFHPPE